MILNTFPNINATWKRALKKKKKLSYLYNDIQGGVSANTEVAAWHIVANSSGHHTDRNAKLVKVGSCFS